MFVRERRLDNIKNQPVLVVCPGHSIKDHRERIQNYIDDNSPVIIGVNQMSSMFVPHLHLWTNKKRYAAAGKTMHAASLPLFSAKMPVSLIRRHWKKSYESIRYTDSPSEITGYKNGVITGWFRTSGILAIMIAHVHGASFIRAVGMDGYTLHPRKKYASKEQNQHCYGSGHTDEYTWDKCLVRDGEMDTCLGRLRKHGVDFRIMTPTKFVSFYES